jgi:hypothetical protein
VTVTCIQKRKITFYKIQQVHPQTSSKTMKKLNKGSMNRKEDENNNCHGSSDHNQPQSGDCLHGVRASVLFTILQEALKGRK